MQYPPRMPDDQFQVLMSDVKDWQITHGSLLKLVKTETTSTVLSGLVGATVFPTLFPQELFDKAISLQKLYNKLYTAVAEDEEWLFSTLRDLIDVDPLVNKLWSIYQEVKQESCIQDISFGIFRSDYMLHSDEVPEQPQLKQVEFNTIACAGGVHSYKISAMHRHLHRKGSYNAELTQSQRVALSLSPSTLPLNRTLETLASGLALAHKAYGLPVNREANETCILFIVQPDNFNVADERPIEHALWDRSIPAFRVTFGYEVLSHTSHTSSGELLYRPPHQSIPMEVSVVYYRAGFEASEYDDMGYMSRLQLERSRAIKCPSLLSHLSTLKKVQQSLALPSALERFLAPEEVVAIEETFMPMVSLDKSRHGTWVREMVSDKERMKNWVLKPSLEGGGHNVYGEDIVQFLNNTPRELWRKYILMANINPPMLENVLMTSREVYEGAVISELGIFGVCLWKSKRRSEKEGTGECVSDLEILEELDPCWSFKTKDASVDEMSVVKGYGCFDSPALIDWDLFSACLGSTLRRP